jgi:hypothetical protein
VRVGQRLPVPVAGKKLPKLVRGVRRPAAGGHHPPAITLPAISLPAPGEFHLEGYQSALMYQVLPFPDELEVRFGPKPAWDAFGRALKAANQNAAEGVRVFPGDTLGRLFPCCDHHALEVRHDWIAAPRWTAIQLPVLVRPTGNRDCPPHPTSPVCERDLLSCRANPLDK